MSPQLGLGKRESRGIMGLHSSHTLCWASSIGVLYFFVGRNYTTAKTLDGVSQKHHAKALLEDLGLENDHLGLGSGY